MKAIFRNIFRQKIRSFLTIFGISIGIFALVVMGSMSEYFNNLIDRSVRYSAEIVRVFPKAALAGPTSGILPVSEVDQFKKIPDVRVAAPAMFTSLSDQTGLSTQLAIGLPPENSQDLFEKVGLQSGRYLQAGDKNQAVIGHTLATSGNLSIGSKKSFRNKEFEIVGIANATQVDGVDSLAIVPLQAAQEMNKLEGFANAIILFPKDKTKAQEIADKVKADYPRFNALSPKDVVNDVKKGLLIFNVIILAGAFLAAVVGGFATLNTMIMSVTERTREIGIKKALGASNGEIVKEYLLESAVIGFLGGSLGIILGYLGTIAINKVTTQYVAGLNIFTFTPRLGLIALAFATFLGALAGFLPALKAAKMNIVKALKEL